MPKKSSFLSEKNLVLESIGYNTPSLKDPTITPLVGTNGIGHFDLSDKSSLSIYKQ